MSANLSAPQNYIPDPNILAGSPYPTDIEICSSYLFKTYCEYEGKSKKPTIDVKDLAQTNFVISSHPVTIKLIPPSSKHFITFTRDSTFPIRFLEQQDYTSIQINHSQEIRAVAWKHNMRESELLIQQFDIQRDGEDQFNNEGIARPEQVHRYSADLKFDYDDDDQYPYDSAFMDTPQYGSVHQKDMQM